MTINDDDEHEQGWEWIKVISNCLHMNFKWDGPTPYKWSCQTFSIYFLFTSEHKYTYIEKKDEKSRSSHSTMWHSASMVSPPPLRINSSHDIWTKIQSLWYQVVWKWKIIFLSVCDILLSLLYRRKRSRRYYDKTKTLEIVTILTHFSLWLK